MLFCHGEEQSSFYDTNREELQYYEEAICAYINAVVESDDFEMEYISMLSSDYQAVYFLSNGYIRIPVYFVGLESEQGVKHFIFNCEISDYLRSSDNYFAVILAVVSLCMDILDVNYPNIITADDIEDAMMQVVEYYKKGDMDSYYEYYFENEKNELIMFDVLFSPEEEGSTDGVISIWLDI